MKKHLLFFMGLFVSILLPQNARAQMEMGIHFSSTVPSTNLLDQGLSYGYGGGLELWSPLYDFSNHFNVQVGLRGNFGIHEYFNTGLDFYDFENDLEGEFYVSSANLHGMGLLRLSAPEHWKFRLYLEGGLGRTMMTTYESIEFSHSGDDCPSADTYNLARTGALSFGFGTGFLIHLSDYVKLDFGVWKLEGTPLEFVDFNSLEVVSPGNYNFNTSVARQEQWILRVGMNFSLVAPPNNGGGNCSGSSDNDYIYIPVSTSGCGG